MRLGWGRDDGPFFVPRTQAARALRAGAHSTLHGVVFAILCLGSAVYRRRGAALRPGHEIVSASRSRRIDPTPMHHALARTRNLARQPLDSGFVSSTRPGMTTGRQYARSSHIRVVVRADIGDAQHVGGAGGAERHARDDDDALASPG